MEKDIIDNDIIEKDTELMVVEVIASEFASLIEDNLDPKVYFKKKKYPDYFEKYCSEKKTIFEHISRELENIIDEDQPDFLEQIAGGLVEKAKKEISALKGMKKRNRQSELNLFLVTSVFPCILKLGDEYGEELCKFLAAQWKKAFPGNELGYADYDKLNSSFRSFWGFLTGR